LGGQSRTVLERVHDFGFAAFKPAANIVVKDLASANSAKFRLTPRGELLKTTVRFFWFRRVTSDAVAA
jgi:hypothetical protein